ncbi:MAG: cob(I)yrinic acid a,c-diamide adenosyltransferase [Candidatus Bilamarchaeaceae archaeon]
MPIYTRFGDKGDTVILSGRTVRKDDPLVEATGTIDELNAALGVVIAFTDDSEFKEILSSVQKDLFVIGAELVSEKTTKRITPAKTEFLERKIDEIEPKLERLTHFIIPGGSKTAAVLHLARTICRRAERRVVSASSHNKINPEIVKYLNRLSDLLFILARYENRKKRFSETLWRGK